MYHCFKFKQALNWGYYDLHSSTALLRVFYQTLYDFLVFISVSIVYAMIKYMLQKSCKVCAVIKMIFIADFDEYVLGEKRKKTS